MLTISWLFKLTSTCVAQNQYIIRPSHQEEAHNGTAGLGRNMKHSASTGFLYQ